MKLYSLFDAKAGIFTPPFDAKNDELARRILCESYKRVGDCALTQYPSDFTLFRIGEFDADKGKLIPAEVLDSLGTVVQIVSMMKPERVESTDEDEVSH